MAAKKENGQWVSESDTNLFLSCEQEVEKSLRSCVQYEAKIATGDGI